MNMPAQRGSSLWYHEVHHTPAGSALTDLLSINNSQLQGRRKCRQTPAPSWITSPHVTEPFHQLVVPRPTEHLTEVF